MADKSGSYPGHDENTAPSSVDGKNFMSPATYAPLSDSADAGVNTKRPDGEKGR